MEKIRYKIYETDYFYSCFGIKNLNTIFSNETDLNESADYQMSCIQFQQLTNERFSKERFHLESQCVGQLICDAYKIDSKHRTISEKKFCPLNGTIKSAKIFLHKKFKFYGEFNRIYILIDGCFFIDENQVKQEVYWIMTERVKVEKTVLINIFNNEWVFKIYSTEDINFGEFDRNCSKLCEKQTCFDKELISGEIPGEIEFSIGNYIFFIVIFIELIFLVLVYCFET